MKRILNYITLLSLWIFLNCTLAAAEQKSSEPLFSFGAVADCQYCSKTSLIRKYNLSPKKLAACVEYYNKLDLAFVVHLGDFAPPLRGVLEREPRPPLPLPGVFLRAEAAGVFAMLHVAKNAK